MSITSLVLGIIAVLIGWYPCTIWVAWILAVVGLVLGIIGCVQDAKAGRPKGKAIAGIILCSIGLVEGVIFWFCIAAAAASGLSAA